MKVRYHAFLAGACAASAIEAIAFDRSPSDFERLATAVNAGVAIFCFLRAIATSITIKIVLGPGLHANLGDPE